MNSVYGPRRIPREFPAEGEEFMYQIINIFETCDERINLVLYDNGHCNIEHMGWDIEGKKGEGK